MLAEKDALYVLHRRNLTRISEADGQASRFDRIIALPHGIAENYDYGYGLVRDKTGAFVLTFAHAHSFENSMNVNWDGGVIEVSTDARITTTVMLNSGIIGAPAAAPAATPPPSPQPAPARSPAQRSPSRRAPPSRFRARPR